MNDINSLHEAILELSMEIAESALNSSKEDIVNELPSGKASPIADKLIIIKTSDNTFEFQSDSPVWAWLQYGTGIYNPNAAGEGPGGAIIPIHAKALHFKNREIASALGFKGEDVFLRQVKGIQPRYFYERHIESNLFNRSWDNSSEHTYL